MSNALATVLIVGVPLTLSLSWFVYWVVRLYRFGRKKGRGGAP
jgi:hypothetical protein